MTLCLAYTNHTSRALSPLHFAAFTGAVLAALVPKTVVMGPLHPAQMRHFLASVGDR